jgi:hypothetical protein
MELGSGYGTIASPSKLNPEWLKDVSFENIVN